MLLGSWWQTGITLDLVIFCMSGSIFLLVFHHLCSQRDSLTCSGDAAAALKEGVSWQSWNFPAVLLEMGRRLGRIQNFLGCHQSCAEFMAMKLFKVADLAQSNQTELEQLWANILGTAGKLSTTINRENPVLKNYSKTLHMQNMPSNIFNTFKYNYLI